MSSLKIWVVFYADDLQIWIRIKTNYPLEVTPKATLVNRDPIRRQ